ncbi:MAG: SPOR domain-containing protein [Thiobacillus sp.]
MAKSPSRRTDRAGSAFPRKEGTVFSGVMIGLIVGAVLAVGVALWITGNNPFKSSTPDASLPAKLEPAAPATPETAPSFDFYKMLPSDATSEAPPSPPPAAITTLYYLQAGAFQNPADADNLKAQLALLGIETVIQTRDLGGDLGVFHRVRVGPFLAMDEINDTRALLTQNNIPATLVKEVPTTQETP